MMAGDRPASAAQREGLLLIAGAVKCRELGVDWATLTRREAQRLRLILEHHLRHGDPPENLDDPPAPDLRRRAKTGSRRGGD